MDTYLASSNFSSSLFAFDATKFTADDTLLSTALLLSNFPLSFSIDIGVDVASDDVVVVVVVAAPVVDAKDDEFEFKWFEFSLSLTFAIDDGTDAGDPAIEFDALLANDDVISVFTPFTVL